MSDKTINEEINTYFSLLTPLQKESVLGLIKSFLKTDKRVSVKEYNAELAEAEEHIAQGKFTLQEDLEKESEKW
jgi:hypothetical protein